MAKTQNLIGSNEDVNSVKDVFYGPTDEVSTAKTLNKQTVQNYTARQNKRQSDVSGKGTQREERDERGPDQAEIKSSPTKQKDSGSGSGAGSENPPDKTEIQDGDVVPWSQRVAGELKDAIRYDFINIIAASFLFVTALSWNSTLNEFFDSIPSLKSSSKLIYSISVTVLAVLFIRIASKVVRKKR